MIVPVLDALLNAVEPSTCGPRSGLYRVRWLMCAPVRLRRAANSIHAFAAFPHEQWIPDMLDEGPTTVFEGESRSCGDHIDVGADESP